MLTDRHYNVNIAFQNKYNDSNTRTSRGWVLKTYIDDGTKMKKIITIIGCGAVGVSQLYHLVEQLISDNIAANFEILIFEKSSSLGQGVAYGEDSPSNLLNRTAGAMSLIHDKPDDFICWLKNNKNKWNDQFPNIKINQLKETFLPRFLFGIYAEDVLRQTIYRARRYKLKISFIHDEAINIEKYHDEYKIYTKNNWQLLSSIIILAVGNLPAKKFGDFNNNPAYFNSPYPTKNLTAIPKNASVGILGSRLSAIDAAISLAEYGHKGEVAFIARKGYFPSIKADYEAYRLKFISERYIAVIAKEKRQISLAKIVKLLISEAEFIYGKRLSFKKFFQRQTDLKKHLDNEFKTYQSIEKMIWQNILISLNAIVENVWNVLKNSDKERFHSIYKSLWMACRVSIPYQNAKKIYKLVLDNRLTLKNGFQQIKFNGQKFIIQTESGKFEYDYIIDATGNSDDVKLIESNLLNNMLVSGLINENKFGGVDVDFETSRVINSDNLVEDRFFVIGNLTSGVYFFTSVLELNINHAFKIAKAISREYLSDYQEKTSISHAVSGYLWQLSNDNKISKNMEIL